MTSEEQELLSRFVDGDLAPSEAARVQLLIATDTSARTLYGEYKSLGESLGELPRPAIPEDMVARLRPLLDQQSRFPWLVHGLDHGGRWVAAAAVFSLVSISAGLLLFRPKLSESKPLSSSKILTVAVDDARDPVAEPDAIAANEKDKARVDDPTGVELVENSKLRALPESVPAITAKPSTRLDQFLESLKTVDRRHSIRLHVGATNARVEAAVLAQISKFRRADTEMARMAETGAEDGVPSLRFIALVPTSDVDDLVESFRTQFPDQLELDRPEDLQVLKQNPGKVELIDSGRLEQLLEKNEKPISRSGDQRKSRTSIGDEPVLDALAKPLVAGASASGSGTMDEVMIQIRSDLLTPDAKTGSSTKPARRGAAKADR